MKGLSARREAALREKVTLSPLDRRLATAIIESHLPAPNQEMTP
jgi:hypothetical protein